MPLVERSHGYGSRFFLLQMEVISFRTTPLQYIKKKKNLGQVLKDTLDLLLWYRIATISFVRWEMLVS